MKPCPVSIRTCQWVILAVAAFVVAPSNAEFYSWEDADGRRRISNIPPAGVDADGGVLPGHHPLSISAQHARLRARLKQETLELERAAIDADEPSASEKPLLPFSLEMIEQFGGAVEPQN